MAIPRSFRELRTSQLARERARRVFAVTQTFPPEVRSSRAVKAILAEARGRRRHRAVFVCTVDESLGEACETQSWLDDALDCGYIDPTVHHELDALYGEIAATLNALINRADDFCKNAPDHGYLHEESGRYQTGDDAL